MTRRRVFIVIHEFSDETHDSDPDPPPLCDPGRRLWPGRGCQGHRDLCVPDIATAPAQRHTIIFAQFAAAQPDTHCQTDGYLGTHRDAPALCSASHAPV